MLRSRTWHLDAPGPDAPAFARQQDARSSRSIAATGLERRGEVGELRTQQTAWILKEHNRDRVLRAMTELDIMIAQEAAIERWKQRKDRRR